MRELRYIWGTLSFVCLFVCSVFVVIVVVGVLLFSFVFITSVGHIVDFQNRFCLLLQTQVLHLPENITVECCTINERAKDTQQMKTNKHTYMHEFSPCVNLSVITIYIDSMVLLNPAACNYNYVIHFAQRTLLSYFECDITILNKIAATQREHKVMKKQRKSRKNCLKLVISIRVPR